ncbi:MAG TPA: HIT family protein [Pyrinomonadaceae bacterium]|jgi:diadenosine tetraphosphate (Ap4A) HIT family hydrolase
MSKWSDRSEWEGLLNGEACPICRDGKPTNIVSELQACYLVAGEEAVLKGSCALFFKRHVVELHDLTADEASAFIGEVQRVSKAVLEATGAVKMNYEIHGNTIPHLHMHLFPRYEGDPFENRPIDPRLPVRAYAPGEFADYVEKLRSHLRNVRL